MRICVIFNPTARGDKARRFRTHLDSIGHLCALKATMAAGHARVLAAEAIQEGYDTVVAAGGDGTLNEVVNGIGDVPNGFARTRVGVLPLGTINVFAREIGLPLRLMPAWRVILEGGEMVVDLPRAELEINGRSGVRYFLQLSGAGLDSRAISLVDWEAKKKLGPLAYIRAGFKALREPQPVIHAGDGRRTVTGEMVLVGNGRFYGGSIKMFPQASLRDGRLHVCVFPKVSLAVLCRAVFGFATGSLPRACHAIEFDSDSVTLAGSGRVLLELDGDNAGALPARLGIQPAALRVIVPAK